MFYLTLIYQISLIKLKKGVGKTASEEGRMFGRGKEKNKLQSRPFLYIIYIYIYIYIE